MKTLTVVATIFLPLTFVAGVYGMNFADSPYDMPELGRAFGYPAAMLGMVGVALVMLWHFQDRGYV
jgi:magnesium transporter